MREVLPYKLDEPDILSVNLVQHISSDRIHALVDEFVVFFSTNTFL